MSALPTAEQLLDPDSIEYKVTRAQTAIERLLRAGYPCCVSWSAGKDSSALLNLVLTTAARLAAQGVALPPIVVTTADTGIENPSMSEYVRNEMRSVRAYARRHGLSVQVEVAHPHLADSWPVRVIGGRALPPFPGGSRDCASDWKAAPLGRLRKKVMQSLEQSSSGQEPVVLIGTRYSESSVRGANMRERGESDVEIRRGIDESGKPSHLFLSPLAHWHTDDVWEYLGSVRGGALEGYSTFEETMRVYADAMGVSCVIVAEDMSQSVKASKACGARHGCSLCTATGDSDKSMENMLASDTRYAYMRPLNDLRNFLVATRWDMDRRAWLGRTIKEGYVRIGPDAYSPAMMEELLRYALTIDANERQAAEDAGIRPRFQLVSIEQLFAIDAMWSLQAFHKPFHALAIWRDIQEGARYPVPRLDTFPRPKEIPERFLWVGRDWEDGERRAYTGLRSVLHELAAVDNAGCMGTREISAGRAVMDMNVGGLLEFDTEGLYFILDDLDNLLRRYHAAPNAHPTCAYTYYASLGVMSIRAGKQAEVDEILRRSDWKVRNGIAGQADGRRLWEMAVSREEAGLAPAAKRKARGADGSLSTSHEVLVEGGGAAATALAGGSPLPSEASPRAPGEQLVIFMHPFQDVETDAAEEPPACAPRG